MKKMFENEKVFEAYAEIDYCYYLIERINDKLNKPTSPIERMIDQASGFAKARDQKVGENRGFKSIKVKCV